MRQFLLIFFLIFTTLPASAIDLAATHNKTNSHVGHNPGTPDGREGGEDMDTAIVINTLPFDDTGNTSDNIDDYGYPCPYGTMAPDVVYSYTPSTDKTIKVDLCGSQYDTNTFIMDGNYNVIACNDDGYFDDVCGLYVSVIHEAFLLAGVEYFIIIDGYGSDSGDYILNVCLSDPPAPWPLTCDGLDEGEPPLGTNYNDSFNGGCNSPEQGNPFADLTQAGDANGNLVFCGTSGWFTVNTSSNRDTDWMLFMVGETGTIEWTLEAEYQVNGLLLEGDCDAGITVADEMHFDSPTIESMTIQGDPGEVVMLWVGPSSYSPPSGFQGYEFQYKCTFTGLYSGGPVPTSRINLDSLKSLYR